MILAAEATYILCTLTSLACAALLLRAYRRSGERLLFWSGLCFLCLCINNMLLVVDIIVAGPALDLSIWRLLPALLGVGMLCYGLIEGDT